MERTQFRMRLHATRADGRCGTKPISSAANEETKSDGRGIAPPTGNENRICETNPIDLADGADQSRFRTLRMVKRKALAGESATPGDCKPNLRNEPNPKNRHLGGL